MRLISENGYGGKANSLLLLKENGYRVPKGFIVSYKEFIDVIKENDKFEYFVDLINSDNILYRFQKLKQLIFDLEIPRNFVSSLTNKISPLGIEIIVRSSGSTEDSETSSMAGLYESCVTKNRINEFINALKICWASAFTAKVFSAFSEFGEINIIVQEYINFKVSGVAFSTDVTSSDQNHLIIEAVEGNCDKLVDGYGFTSIYRIPKEENRKFNFKDDNILNIKQQVDIRNILLRLKKEFNADVDVEWGITLSGDLVILQCRPITANNSALKKASPGEFIETTDITSFSKIDLAQCSNHYQGFLNKKYWARRVLILNNQRVPFSGYLFYNNSILDSSFISNLTNKFKSTLIEIRNDERDVIIPNCIEEVDRLLKDFANSDYTVVYITEIIHTDKSGFATLMTDGNIYIETISGGFHGFWRGGTSPSKYIVSPKGRIIKEEIISNSTQYNYDPILKSWVESPSKGNQSSILSELEINQIIEMTLLLEKKIGYVSIEWTSNHSEGVYYFDLSQEKREKVEISESFTTLSSGIADGKVRIIDSKVLDNIFESFHDVNVVKKESYHSKVNSELIQQNLKNLVGIESIVVCEFPNRTLAPLVPLVKGFIFNRGAMLCHLGIILRESNIPAVIMKDATSLLDEGSVVTIVNGEIYH